MEEEKDKASTRIKALLSKTVENGATEAEAEAALAMAMKLMAKYELNLTEAELRSQGLIKLETDFRAFGKLEKTFINEMLSWIEKLCEVKCVIYSKHSSLNRVEWFGLAIDVKYAEYVSLIFIATVKVEADKWWKAPENYRSGVTAAMRAHLKESFILGYAKRLKIRIREAIELRNNSRNGLKSSNGAMVAIGSVKSSMVDEAFNKQWPDLKEVKLRKQRQVNSAAFMGGAEAGKNVNWERPIENSAP